MKNIKFRLIIMNFLEFAVWGAYLTSMGRYLDSHGLAANIGWFYSVQGIVSLFMPAIAGIVADRWMQAQKVLSLCHGLAGVFMAAAGIYAFQAGQNVALAPLFTLYTMSVGFFMPTIALVNSVGFNAMVKANMDTVKDFPAIRVFGTVGFILTMWTVDLLGAMDTPAQFVISGGLSIIFAIYALTLPACEVKKLENTRSLVDALGLKAFMLFKEKKMALFFVFSMLLGMCLQVTNAYASPYLGSFEFFQQWSNSFGVQHSGILISVSQICEALCILTIPFFLQKFGIKNVIFMSLIAWVIRFGFFGLGNPGFPGVLLFVLSCIVYGFAFDFFNVSGALFVDRETDEAQRSSAQGLFMMMTNGVGATIGTLCAQVVVNHLVITIDGAKEAELGIVRDSATNQILWDNIPADKLQSIADSAMQMWQGWQTSWLIFAGFAFVVGIAFWILFPRTPINS